MMSSAVMCQTCLLLRTGGCATGLVLHANLKPGSWATGIQRTAWTSSFMVSSEPHTSSPMPLGAYDQKDTAN
jgi:hypothetical protein